MRTIAQLCDAAFRSAQPHLPTALASDIASDIAAGEYEVAMITLVEAAPVAVSVADVHEFERVARDFDAVDGPIARRVIAAYRHSWHVSA